MSHHYSGPDFTHPHDDARLDFCDLFAFPKPEDSSRSILIMDVHPSVSVNPEGPTSDEPFAPEAIYELKVDTDRDAVADIAYRVLFSPSENGAQSATVRRVEGSDAAGAGEGGEAIIEDAPVSRGSDAQVTEAGDYRFFAGWRSEPFFYDALGLFNDFQFTGDDFFADKDVCSIVLELPNSELGATEVGLWQRSLVPADGGGWVQVDRQAHAQQVTVLTPNEGKVEYLAGEPADDARFVESIAHVLEQAGGYSAEEARRLAEPMLPDILPYDPTRPVGYPDNGRLLTDDVGDYVLAILTNGRVTEDKVGPHEDFLSEFPYLGPPHEDRTGA
jgi:Domain of unknown function (DUF4331)